jgi:hypothetical protein
VWFGRFGAAGAPELPDRILSDQSQAPTCVLAHAIHRPANITKHG